MCSQSCWLLGIAAAYLHRYWSLFARFASPSSGWKLVIVDNGSTDSTHEIVHSYEKRLPLEYLLEPTLGKSAALNTGLGAVEGDLIIFADDDIFPNPNWLIQLRSAADANPEYSIFGGRILPRWEVPPPSWIQWVEQSPAYAVTYPLLKEGGRLSAPRLWAEHGNSRESVHCRDALQYVDRTARDGLRAGHRHGIDHPTKSTGTQGVVRSRRCRRSFDSPGADEQILGDAPCSPLWARRVSARVFRGKQRILTNCQGSLETLYWDCSKKG